MIRGILFDVDGVLINSEEQIAQACIEFFKRRGVNAVPADFAPFIGAGENRFIGGVAEKYGLTIDIEAAKIEAYGIYDELISGTDCAMKGTADFIRNAKKAELKTALATSADKIKLDINLKAIGFSTGDFDYAVWGNKVTHKKPDPEIYLTAAAGLGLNARDCLVVEDALNGVQAAKAAGALCIGLLGSFSEEELKNAGADIVLKDLSFFGSFSSHEEFKDRLEALVK
ncbi:HAD-IA family hydrolase [Treponema sp. HNW]|uniref:HAD family hydrolase n=1 Tax=Treponema sp. HNW TaxID=3116654 RepID=UPI003D1329FE